MKRLPLASGILRPLLTLMLPAIALVTALGQPQGKAESNPPSAVMRVAGGKLDITLPEEPLKLSTKDLLQWVRTAAGAVSNYYGHFPVPHLTLEIHASRREGINHGVTYPKDGGLIRINVGTGADIDDLKNDWVLTHEMIHLAFPSMADNHHWIEEGISTYVEPIARAQVGQFPAAVVWKQFIRDMPKGQSGDGDAGLDNTPTWGRTYWGGAMFCLLADVQIRERTRNRKGLRDALRAILNHGGVISADWDIEKALAIGDKATGVDVLQSLYKQMRDKPSPVDLNQLWQELGVSLKDDEVEYNDRAAEAAIRKAICAPVRSLKH